MPLSCICTHPCTLSSALCGLPFLHLKLPKLSLPLTYTQKYIATNCVARAISDENTIRKADLHALPLLPVPGLHPDAHQLHWP
eukprot:scaffold20972_cov20-Tisochrysis_lutea.AAC.1